MPSILSEHESFQDTGGKPLVNGKIWIGVQNQDPVTNPQTIYSDRDLQTSIDNPQSLDGYGRATNKIFVAGEYSIRIDDSSGTQIYQELDAGSVVEAGITGLLNVQGTDTLTASGNPPVVTLIDQQLYVFKTTAANTGAVTLKIDATAAKSITKRHNDALISGDLDANQVVVVAYNSTDDVFAMVSPPDNGQFNSLISATSVTAGTSMTATTSVTAGTTVSDALGDVRAARGFINGLSTALDADPSHDILINPGECADSTGVFFMDLGAILTKKIDLDWVEGDDQGGLSTGSRSVADTPNASTWYHYFVISKTDGTVDAGWDTSLTATNLLADAINYTYYRRIASHYIDGSNNITAYKQFDNYFSWDVTVLEVNTGSAPTSPTAITLQTPLGIECEAKLTLWGDNLTTWHVLFRETNNTQGATAGRAQIGFDSSGAAAAEAQVYTNTSSQIEYDADVASVDVTAYLLGYTDNRGQY